MFSKRDKVKLIYIIILISYLLWRYINIIDINYNIIDMLVLYSIPYFLWYINCYKNFTMTQERLKKYPFNKRLEYCTYEYGKTSHKRKIYVRVLEYNPIRYCNEGTWYELDYDRTISKDSYLHEYNKFIKSHSTVMELSILMNKNNIKDFKDIDYKFFKILSFILISVLILIHMLCIK